MTRKLRAPPGTDEANFAGERFRVDNDGTIDVPDAAAPELLKIGGFVEVKEIPPLTDGSVRMMGPDGATSVSWGGQSFAAVKEGVFDVPLASVHELASHGFVLVE